MSTDPSPQQSVEQDPDDKLVLFEQAKAGDAKAWKRFLDLYSVPLMAVIRQRLHQPLRRLFDSNDVKQMAWEAILDGSVDFKAVKSPQDLWPFLQGLMRNKVRQLDQKYLHTQKRSLSRDQPLTSENHPDPHSDPSEQVDEDEEELHRLRNLAQGNLAILLALRNGDRLEEIAARCGISVKTIRRVSERCKLKH